MLSRMYRSFLCATLFGLATLSAVAATYTFKPNDGEGDYDDMLDLDHYKYFTWGFKNFTVPTGEYISKATLTIFNINNWTADENGIPVYKKNQYGQYVYVNGKKVVDYYLPENWLNIWLLDSAQNNTSTYASTSGKLKVYNDNDGSSDYFGNNWNYSAKQKIATYTDWSGGSNGNVETLVYDFANYGVLDDLQNYVANGGNFALGLDPDCHFWNTGVQLVIETKPYSVPETAGTLGLAGAGLGFLALLRCRVRK